MSALERVRPNWLRKGITGFMAAAGDESVVVEVGAFKTACHGAAREVHGSVLAIWDRLDRPTLRNFFAGFLGFPDGRVVALLLNGSHPLIAFASCGPDALAAAGKIEFVDAPALAAGLPVDYEVLGKEELDTPFRMDERVSDVLAATELEQIRYWAPKRVGDVVFNYWD